MSGIIDANRRIDTTIGCKLSACAESGVSDLSKVTILRPAGVDDEGCMPAGEGP